jgi:hypothetical protein
MVDQLQKPSAEFAAVIKSHFKLRGRYILEQVDGWIVEASGLHRSNLQTLRGQLEQELNKLA